MIATEPFHAYVASSGYSRLNFRGGRGRGWFHSNFGSHFHSRNHHLTSTNNSSGRGFLPTHFVSFPGNNSIGHHSPGYFSNCSGLCTDYSLTCQICEHKGHSTLTCCQRLNLSYNANVVHARFQAPSAHCLLIMFDLLTLVLRIMLPQI